MKKETPTTKAVDPKEVTDIITQNGISFELYNNYIEAGFALRIIDPKTKKTTHSRKSEDGCNYRNHPFKEDTLYCAIPTPDSHLLIIDVDVKDGKKGMESLQRLSKDTGLKLTPSVRTGSGGIHIYCRINTPVKQTQDTYPDIEFQSFRTDNYCAFYGVAGGQVIEDYKDSGKPYNYTMLTDNGLPYINEDVGLNDVLEELTSNTKTTQRDSDEIPELILPPDELNTILNNLNVDDMHYLIWIKVGMAIYDYYNGSVNGKEKWLQFTKRSKKHTKGSTMAEDKWDRGYLVPDAITYNWLRYEYVDQQRTTILKELSVAESDTDFDSIVSLCQNIPMWATHDKQHKEVLEELISSYQAREKTLGRTVTRKDTLKNTLTDNTPMTPDVKNMVENLLIGFDGGTYTVCNRKTQVRSNAMTKSGLGEYLMKIGVPKKKVDDVVKKASVNISAIMQETDYLLQSKAVFSIEKHPTDPIADKVLMVYSNPLWDITQTDFDMDIVNDFMDNVWAGKMYDILRLTALTIIHKDKKNIIGVVAPPNSTKSKSFQILGAPKVKMQPLVSAINGVKGIGKPVIDDMTSSGLLLIDEVDKPVPDEMKDFVEGLTLDQFGAGGGTKNVPLRCTFLTSIHDTMFSKADAEIIERCVMVKVTDGKHTIKDSPLYKQDPKKYFEHTTAFILWTFKQEFVRESNKDELLELQERYRIEVKGEDILDDILDEVTRDIITSTMNNLLGFAIKHGVYFVKDKTAVKEAIETQVHHHDLPNKNGKISDLMDKIFYSEHKAKDRKRVSGVMCWESKIKSTPDDGFEDGFDIFE